MPCNQLFVEEGRTLEKSLKRLMESAMDPGHVPNRPMGHKGRGLVTEPILRVSTSIALFVGILSLGLFGAWAVLRLGLPDYLAVIVPSVVCTFLILGVQRWIPFDPRWRAWKTDAGIDVAHSLFSNIGATAIFDPLFMVAMYTVANWLSAALGATLWPTSWPMPVQVGLALVIGELGTYWAHRAYHEVPFLWRFHAVHHSSERMHALAALRNHPGNVLMSYVAKVAPLVLLGAHGEVLVFATIFNGVHGPLQHANIDFRLGWLNYILAGPELHRVHHSKDRVQSSSNYGNVLSIFDVLFATRNYDHAPSVDVGLSDVELRRNYWWHLALPFRWKAQTGRRAD